MTAIIGSIFPERIIVATDTLASRKGITLVPLNFVCKIFPLPQKNSVIIGVGGYEILHDWHCIAEKHIVAEDILTLDSYSSTAMKQYLSPKCSDVYTCIYQLGFDQEGNSHAFKYDSCTGFEGEKLEGKIFMRPSIDNVDDVIRQSQGKDSNFYDTLFRMMEIQKYQDELLPINERVGIGGRIEIMVLENGSYTLFNYKKFDDYDSLYESVLENCQIQ